MNLHRTAYFVWSFLLLPIAASAAETYYSQRPLQKNSYQAAPTATPASTPVTRLPTSLPKVAVDTQQQGMATAYAHLGQTWLCHMPIAAGRDPLCVTVRDLANSFPSRAIEFSDAIVDRLARGGMDLRNPGNVSGFLGRLRNEPSAMGCGGQGDAKGATFITSPTGHAGGDPGNTVSNALRQKRIDLNSLCSREGSTSMSAQLGTAYTASLDMRDFEALVQRNTDRCIAQGGGYGAGPGGRGGKGSLMVGDEKFTTAQPQPGSTSTPQNQTVSLPDGTVLLIKDTNGEAAKVEKTADGKTKVTWKDSDGKPKGGILEDAESRARSSLKIAVGKIWAWVDPGAAGSSADAETPNAVNGVRGHCFADQPGDCAAVCRNASITKTAAELMYRYRYDGCGANTRPVPDGDQSCFRAAQGMGVYNPEVARAVHKKWCGLVQPGTAGGYADCAFYDPAKLKHEAAMRQSVCRDPRAMCSPDQVERIGRVGTAFGKEKLPPDGVPLPNQAPSLRMSGLR